MRGLVGRLLSLAVLAVLAGCVTAPPVPREPGAAAAWLGGAPRVVVRLDAKQVLAWGQVTKSRESLKTVGERTSVLWLGFELDSLDDFSRAGDSVRLVLEGDYPRAGAGFLLDWNGAWKKNAGGTWSNAALGFSVSLPEDGLVAVRRHDPEPPQPSAGVLRDLDPLRLQDAALWVSFWDPGEALFGSPGARLLPVQRLDIVLTAREGGLEGPVILRFGDARTAWAAGVMLKLLAPQIRSRIGQDLDWTVEDTQVVGRTLRLHQADLQALAETLVAGPPEEGKP